MEVLRRCCIYGLTLGLLVVSLVPSQASAFSGSGAGTTGDPYRISTCEELQEITADADAEYLLTGDIDCSDTPTWNGGAGFTPLTPGIGFEGVLDGNGYTISGLYINNTTSADSGLFASMSYPSRVEQLHLTDATIIGTNGNIGLLAGSISDTTISDVTGHGITITHTMGGASSNAVGGLTGATQAGSITRVSLDDITITTDTDNAVGGIIGRMAPGDISDSYFNGNLTSTGSTAVGGVAGQFSSFSNINRVYSTGELHYPNGANVGGVVGLSGGPLDNSFSTIELLGATPAGGIAGFVSGSFNNNTYDVMATGAVDCSMAGGVTGCTAVNAVGTEDDYYINNDIADPLAAWDFSTVWYTRSASLPQLRGAPDSVENVQVQPTPTSLTVFWDAPADNGGSPITSYSLDYTPHGGTSTTLVTGLTPTADPQSYTIPGLSPNTQYDIRIRATNALGHGAWLGLITSTTAPAAAQNTGGSGGGTSTNAVTVAVTPTVVASNVPDVIIAAEPADTPDAAAQSPAVPSEPFSAAEDTADTTTDAGLHKEGDFRGGVFVTILAFLVLTALFFFIIWRRKQKDDDKKKKK